MSELLAQVDGAAYVVRRSLHDVVQIKRAKKAIREAFDVQQRGLGFAMVELLSSCPTNWGMKPDEALSGSRRRWCPPSRSATSRCPRGCAPACGPQGGGRMSTVHSADLVIAGFGGQGVLFAGQLLAHAALDAGLQTTWIPSYGPEMRGGTANCTVVVADEPIGSPVVGRPQRRIVLNLPSLDRYEPLVAPGGLLVVNTSLVDRAVARTDLDVIAIPGDDVAAELGQPEADERGAARRAAGAPPRLRRCRRSTSWRGPRSGGSCPSGTGACCGATGRRSHAGRSWRTRWGPGAAHPSHRTAGGQQECRGHGGRHPTDVLHESSSLGRFGSRTAHMGLRALRTRLAAGVPLSMERKGRASDRRDRGTSAGRASVRRTERGIAHLLRPRPPGGTSTGWTGRVDRVACPHPARQGLRKPDADA